MGESYEQWEAGQLRQLGHVKWSRMTNDERDAWSAAKEREWRRMLDAPAPHWSEPKEREPGEDDGEELPF